MRSYAVVLLWFVFGLCASGVWAQGEGDWCDDGMVGGFDDGREAYHVQVEGGFAYVLEFGEGVRFFDVSDPMDAVEVGFFEAMERPMWHTVEAGTLYVVSILGIEIVDVSDPSSPVLLGVYEDFRLGLRRAQLLDGVLYVTDFEHGLSIYDVSEPGVPSSILVLDGLNTGRDHIAFGDRLYFQSWDGMELLDMSDPGNPVKIGDVSDFWLWDDSEIRSDLLYQVETRSFPWSVVVTELCVYDITDLLSPVLIGSCEIPVHPVEMIVSGSMVSMLNDGGLVQVDVSDPADPVVVGNLGIAYGKGFDIAGGGGLGFVADGSGVGVYDVSVPTTAEVGSVPTADRAWSVDVEGSRAFVADMAGGLLVVDVSDPGGASVVGSAFTDGFAVDLRVVESEVYVAGGYNGLQIFDVSGGGDPVMVGGFDTPRYANDVVVSGQIAYVADEHSLQMIDVGDPSNPVFAGEFVGGVASVFVEGTTAYVVEIGAGLRILDVADPANPVLIGSYLPTWFGAGLNTAGIEKAGDYVYIVGSGSSLQVIDVGDTSLPALVGEVEFLDLNHGISFDGDRLFVTGDRLGIQEYGVDGLGGVELVASYLPTRGANDVDVVGGIAYIAEGSGGGLLIVDVGDCGVCVADLTGDGVLDFFDISAFLTAFGLQDPLADFSGDGSFDFFDISAFLVSFGAGCP